MIEINNPTENFMEEKLTYNPINYKKDLDSLKKIFLDSYDDYVNQMRKHVVDFDNELGGHETRRRQCKSFINSLNQNFDFDKIVVLETGVSSNYSDGLFGLFLGAVASKTNGKMISVDISEIAVENNLKIFEETLPNLDYSVFVGDSVKFLKETEEIPNILHLDSYDFNLFDPLPSALHGWEEFKAIESKMKKGSIIIVDDNYRGGTWLEWIHPDGRKEVGDIIYPMLGKGAHIYQYVTSNNTEWEIIGNHYETNDNIKIIIQKK
jgi:predicted O-methyltransferase YrrM